MLLPNLLCIVMQAHVQCLNIIRACRDAQTKPAWRDKTRATHTYHLLEYAISQILS